MIEGFMNGRKKHRALTGGGGSSALCRTRQRARDGSRAYSRLRVLKRVLKMCPGQLGAEIRWEVHSSHSRKSTAQPH
jgi:hypothetical protein